MILHPIFQSENAKFENRNQCPSWKYQRPEDLSCRAEPGGVRLHWVNTMYLNIQVHWSWLGSRSSTSWSRSSPASPWCSGAPTLPVPAPSSAASGRSVRRRTRVTLLLSILLLPSILGFRRTGCTYSSTMPHIKIWHGRAQPLLSYLENNLEF